MWLQKGQSHWLFFAKFNKVKTCFHVHVCARLALRSDQTRCLPLVCGVGRRSGNIFQPLLKSHCRHQRLWRTEQKREKGESSKTEGKNDKRVRRRGWERRDVSSIASVWRLLWQVAEVQTQAGWGEGLPAILTEVYRELQEIWTSLNASTAECEPCVLNGKRWARDSWGQFHRLITFGWWKRWQSLTSDFWTKRM